MNKDIQPRRATAVNPTGNVFTIHGVRSIKREDDIFCLYGMDGDVLAYIPVTWAVQLCKPVACPAGPDCQIPSDI